jgi:hypothetical protein
MAGQHLVACIATQAQRIGCANQDSLLTEKRAHGRRFDLGDDRGVAFAQVIDEHERLGVRKAGQGRPNRFSFRRTHGDAPRRQWSGRQ